MSQETQNLRQACRRQTRTGVVTKGAKPAEKMTPHRNCTNIGGTDKN